MLKAARDFLSRLGCRAGAPECTRADGYTEADLLHFAHDHLASAKLLFEASPSCYDSAGYLAHLGIELILKASLLHFDDAFPAVHSLRRLRRRLQRAAPDLAFSEPERKLFNRADRWFPLRYPKPSGSVPIGGSEFPEICSLAFRLLQLLPELLRSEFRSSLEKGGRILVRFPKRANGAT